MKRWNVYRAGGGYVETILASCITKAAKSFMSRLSKPSSLELIDRCYGRIQYKDNHTVMSDYVIYRA